MTWQKVGSGFVDGMEWRGGEMGSWGVAWEAESESLRFPGPCHWAPLGIGIPNTYVLIYTSTNNSLGSCLRPVCFADAIID